MIISNATKPTVSQGMGRGIVKLVFTGFLKAASKEVTQISVLPPSDVEVALCEVAALGRWTIVVKLWPSSWLFGKNNAPGMAFERLMQRLKSKFSPWKSISVRPII